MKRFTVNEDGTVTDTQTGLTWSKTLAKDVTHEKAEEAVAELGEGWRLPTVQELFPLVDHTREQPAIDTEAFPDTERDWYDTERDWYWTSTPTAWNENAVWCVAFGYGLVLSDHRNTSCCVRAVRSGQ